MGVGVGVSTAGTDEVGTTTLMDRPSSGSLASGWGRKQTNLKQSERCHAKILLNNLRSECAQVDSTEQ